MSNLETAPEETACTDGPPVGEVEVLEPRDVPLGGPRAMTVRRTLPQRQRSLIGAWCFADHYGPDDVAASGGMDVPPHPHTGLQTVSWLFAGEVEHRDSLGTHAVIRPGELNLMTGGHGIAHSEVSTPGTTVLHGAQLWVALPDADRHAPKDFQHFAPTPVRLDGATISVFLGSLAGQTSPVVTFTPLLGAEVVLDAGATVELGLDAAYEHGVLADTEGFTVDGTDLARSALAYLPTGGARLTLTNRSDEPARALVLGGPPFDEDILMWWNFVGRTHEEIVEAREEWMAHSDRFGEVEGYAGDVQHLPAPALPAVRIRPRHNASRAHRDS
ncbi:pirin [Phycicoccus sp. Root563]|uniref:pirin family protein n=1 Tax=Phycicoccus sp. Root563 TaxID=1736562 RepID=UPI000702AF91|nr:pirin family protein [Phycicoccus sp. Root563]KQZ91133.1 pirin [Phycicoccus sp. Root563]